MNGLIVDLFAGGGGASVGIEAATGRNVDVAINHDAIALRVHAANHPHTQHWVENVWHAKPEQVTRGRPVGLLWASPDCTHFSVAKGGKPRKQNIRSLAWVVCRWAKAVKPEVILLENVAEFRGWGPLDKDGRPDKVRKGQTFRAWRRRLERLGYVVDYRILDASRYGAPTRRRRLFLVARCDGRPIVWPEPTHGPGLKPFHTAAECIDWSIPCPSIFERKKPLAEKTLWRIAQGIKRFVIENPKPFIVGVGGRAGQSAPTGADEPVGTVTAKNDRALVVPTLVEMNHQNGPRNTDAPLGVITTQHNRHNLVAATMVQTGYGERKGQAPRVLDIEQPHGTIVAGGGKSALVAAMLAKHYGDRGQRPGLEATEPLSTVTASDHHSLVTTHLAKMRGECHSSGADEPAPTLTSGGTHLAEVRAFLVAYYGCDKDGQDMREPMRTITTKDRLGLVTIHGTDYQIVDIGMRMLEPHELLRAQFGRFAAGYDMSAAETKTAKVRLIGNSVCPEVAEAVVRAQFEGRAVQLELVA